MIHMRMDKLVARGDFNDCGDAEPLTRLLLTGTKKKGNSSGCSAASTAASSPRGISSSGSDAGTPSPAQCRPAAHARSASPWQMLPQNFTMAETATDVDDADASGKTKKRKGAGGGNGSSEGDKQPTVIKVSDSKLQAMVDAATKLHDGQLHNRSMDKVQEAMANNPKLTQMILMMIEREEKRQIEVTSVHRNVRSVSTMPDWLKIDILEAVFNKAKVKGVGAAEGMIKGLRRQCLNDLFEIATGFQGATKLPVREATIQTLVLMMCVRILSSEGYMVLLKMLSSLTEGTR